MVKIVAAVGACGDVWAVVERGDMRVHWKYPRIVATAAIATISITVAEPAAHDASWRCAIRYLAIVDQDAATPRLRVVDIGVTRFGLAVIVHHCLDG